MSKSASSAHRVPPYKRPIIVGGFLLILAAVVGITIVVCKQINKSNKDDSTHISSSGDSKDDSQPPTTEPPVPDDDIENKTPQYEGEDPNSLGELTGNIIYKDIDIETQTLHSAVNVSQYLQDGQCVYNIMQSEVILRTASAVITPDVTTSVCGPFALSVDGLPPGIYQIVINLTGNGKQGTITDELEI